MIDREATEQENKRPLTFASLRQTAIIEDVDLRVREASRASFVHGDRISHKQNLHIRGPTGGAKSRIACALRLRRAMTIVPCTK